MLKQLFGSAPKWQSPKSQRRIEAIAELQAEQAADLEILTTLAREDSEPVVRREAVAKLLDIELLQQIQRRDLESVVREAAASRINDLLAGKSAIGPSLEERLERVRRLTATQTLRFLIMEASPIEVRIAAVEQLTDEMYLEDIALKSGIARLRQIAAERISSPAVLESLANLSKHADKSVYRIARDKLDALHAEEKRKQQQQERLQALCESMEQHARAAGTPLYRAKIESLLQQWRELASEATPQLAERFETALELAEAVLAEEAAQLQKAQAETIAAHEQAASCEALEQAMLELRATPDATDLPALAALVKTQELRWQLATEILVPANDVKNRYQKDHNSLREAQALLEAVHSQQQELEQGIQSAQGEAQDIEPLSRIVAGLPSSQGLPLPSILKLAYSLIDQRRAESQAQAQAAASAARREKAPRADAEKHRQLNQQLDALEAAIQRGNSREASHKLRDIQNFTREHHLHDTRLPGLMHRLQELKDWAGYAVLPKKQALLADMEALVERAMDPDEKADVIKTLQDTWRSLGVADPLVETPLWEQFKAASDKAYEPCREYFHEQRELRAQNLAKRQQLCEQLEGYLDALPEGVNARHLESLLHTAREEWQRYHPVDRQHNQVVQQRFNKVHKRLETLLKNLHHGHEQKKRDIIETTRALLASSDGRAACNRVKELQQEWKAIESGPRKIDQQLWKEFRELCDQIFARRDSELQARKSALQSAIEQAEGLIGSQQQLAEAALQGEQNRSAAAPLQEAMRGLDLPREQKHDLHKRFDSARRLHEQNLKLARQNQQDAALNRILAAFSLCARAETAQVEGRLDAGQLREESSRFKLDPPWAAPFAARIATLLEASAEDGVQLVVGDNSQQAAGLCLDLEILLDLPSPPAALAERLEKQMTLLQQNAFNRGHEAREARVQEKLQTLLRLPVPDALAQADILQRLGALLRSGRLGR